MNRFARSALSIMTAAPLLVLSSVATAQPAEPPQMDYGPLVAIPVNNPWALALIALLIMTVGFLALRRSGVRTDRLMTIALPVLSGALVAAALTGPQVTRAVEVLPIKLGLPGGGTVDIIKLGENQFENTSGVTQVIIAIRNLRPCFLMIKETSSELSTLGLDEPLPECVVRGDAQPPLSVDTLAPGDRCVINTADLDQPGNDIDNDDAQNGPPSFCRLPLGFGGHGEDS